jgi:processing peptidase subunit beta
VYYAKLFRKDVDVGMEILGDILQNSLLDSGAVDRERDVILREMEEVNKQHEELILDLCGAASETLSTMIRHRRASP